MKEKIKLEAELRETKHQNKREITKLNETVKEIESEKKRVKHELAKEKENLELFREMAAHDRE